MGLVNLVLIILGAVEGVVLHRILGAVNVPDTTIIGEQGVTMGIRDIIVLAIGLLQVFFGGRIHDALRNMGYGVVAWQVGHELKDVIWSA